MRKTRPFREEYTFEERLQESRDIIAKYPDRVPVVVERFSRTDLPELEKKKNCCHMFELPGLREVLTEVCDRSTQQGEMSDFPPPPLDLKCTDFGTHLDEIRSEHITFLAKLCPIKPSVSLVNLLSALEGKKPMVFSSPRHVHWAVRSYFRHQTPSYSWESTLCIRQGHLTSNF